jgi:hypothetical protein
MIKPQILGESKNLRIFFKEPLGHRTGLERDTRRSYLIQCASPAVRYPKRKIT